MKTSYARALGRKVLLAFIIFVVILAIAALFVRNAVSQQLKGIVAQVEHIEVDGSKPEQILLLLHNAEYDLQGSIYDPGSEKSGAYKTKLLQAFAAVDTLLAGTVDSSKLSKAQYAQVRTWYKQKIGLSANLGRLKYEFDSLLLVYSHFNEEYAAMQDKTGTSLQPGHVKSVQRSTDTVKNKTALKKKKLLGRIRDAISNKEQGASETVINVHQLEVNERTQQAQAQRKAKASYLKELQQLQDRNTSLLHMQQELIGLNSHIAGELESIVNELRSINYVMAAQLKDVAFKSYRESSALINRFCIVALVLVLVFAGLLMLFLGRLNRSEAQLLNENERAISLARQKMDLLHHMSHEVRNPLNSILGFLHIFNETGLTDKQTEMLASMRMSSDMLMDTVNDVLDVAKIDEAKPAFSKAPFKPHVILKQVIESMEPVAAKKGLQLAYEFNGDAADVVLSGDQLRLRQVIVNLLSNAIKYTDKGSVRVNAGLAAVAGKQMLKVEIVDTGAGISIKEQVNLFSKYYRAESANAKVGTGLGLYICKQFIELQGGEIWVKSTEGKGSSFGFSIPYEQDVRQGNENASSPIALLKGIGVLAVDDRGLNLKFLEMMMSSWDVRFYQAKSGAAALEILSREQVSVVLTDIHMPGMDGYELLAAIKKLPAPQNSLPVVAMSGGTDRYDEETMLKAGFAGVGNKPIVEAGLAELIVRVLKL